MPDEPLAPPTAPTAAVTDAAYEAIRAALGRSERGRRFLAEHGRRLRNAGATEAGDLSTSKPAALAKTDLFAVVERLDLA